MTIKGVVKNGVVQLPPEACLSDGTVVHIETVAGGTFASLEGLAGTWEGDDAEIVVEDIYRLRSSAPSRSYLD